MRVLLTGRSGFLGSFTADQLAAEGHVVRALVRPRSDKRVLEKLPGVEFAAGAIEDAASLLPAAENVDAVVHVAGIVKARKPEEFFQVNAQGTRNLLEAAMKRGVRRFVYVSSLAAVGPSVDGTPVADDAEPRPVTHYGRSKLEAERAVLAAKDRLHVTARPPLIYGPRDRARVLTSVRNGVLPMTGDGSNTLSVVYVADTRRDRARSAPAARLPARVLRRRRRSLRLAGRVGGDRERAGPARLRPVRHAAGRGEGGRGGHAALGEGDQHGADAHARQGERADAAALGLLRGRSAPGPRLGAARAVGTRGAGGREVVSSGGLALTAPKRRRGAAGGRA
jgi:uncharacterized protein YbjT (DUF2867 family)